ARGERDTEVALSLSRSGALHTVKLRRTMPQLLNPKSPVQQMLPGAIGYINPCVLHSIQEFEAAFSKVRDSHGLIIDLRGYPNYPGLRLFLTQRLYDHRVKSSVDEIPLVLRHPWRPDSIYLDMVEFTDQLPGEHYAGSVVILINAETQSSPES